ncbi:ras-related protein Rab-40C-like [Argopecten irradians]|uniref:ras-related protein Rab-40C-like n=1 Tax=Argopecten irradians TaxID=31199 RepID=UPI003719DD45
MSSGASSPISIVPGSPKPYDYLLKFLLVGDSDVGKEELLGGMEDGATESPYGFSSCGIDYKTTTILLDGRRVKLQLWDTSGQGRFCTIFRSYSRGAQGILLVYDITNKWSFDGIDRWIKEIDQHAPGVPKILVGNRLHLAFKRQVSEATAEAYALKNDMAFFEVSPLCDFNVTESFAELSRLALKRNGMSRTWGPSKVLSLQEIACHTIVARTTIYGIDQLPLPQTLKSYLKSYALTNKTRARMQSFIHRDKSKKNKYLNPTDSPPANCRRSCCIS